METHQTAFRLPMDLIARIDDYVESMRKKLPGVRITRADAVRRLLARGLDDAERAR